MVDLLELLFARCLCLLPSVWVSNIGAWLGEQQAKKAIRRRRLWVDRLHQNFSRLLGIEDVNQREQLIIEHIRHIGRVYAEYTVLDRLYREGRFTMQGVEHLHLLKGPVIFVCAHIGHWELVGEVLRQHRIQIADLYDPIDDAVKLKLAMEVRQKFAPVEDGNKFIPASSSSIREMMEWMGEGGNLLLFIDEEKDGLVWGPALGRELPSQGNRMLAIKLAARYQAQIVPLHIRRTAPACYEAIIEPAIQPPPKLSDKNAIRKFADELSDQVELWVREDICQWYWLAQLKIEKKFKEKEFRTTEE